MVERGPLRQIDGLVKHDLGDDLGRFPRLFVTWSFGLAITPERELTAVSYGVTRRVRWPLGDDLADVVRVSVVVYTVEDYGGDSELSRQRLASGLVVDSHGETDDGGDNRLFLTCSSIKSGGTSGFKYFNSSAV